MKKQKHSHESAIKSLKKKNDCKVFPSQLLIAILSYEVYSKKLGKIIPNFRRKNDLGNYSLGKIDFLQNYLGYTVVYVPKFS